MYTARGMSHMRLMPEVSSYALFPSVRARVCLLYHPSARLPVRGILSQRIASSPSRPLPSHPVASNRTTSRHIRCRLRRSALSVCPCGDAWGAPLHLETGYSWAPYEPPRSVASSAASARRSAPRRAAPRRAASRRVATRRVYYYYYYY